MLFETIKEDLKTAMKSGRVDEVAVLRFALSGLNSRLKEKQMQIPEAQLTDDEVVDGLQKEVKKRKDAITLYQQGGRTELVEKENIEIAILSKYLPVQMTREEIEEAVKEVIATSQSKEFSIIMKAVREKTTGRADGKMVAEVVKACLG
jgi:uncharacterized protein YqeY